METVNKLEICLVGIGGYDYCLAMGRLNPRNYVSKAPTLAANFLEPFPLWMRNTFTSENLQMASKFNRPAPNYL